MKMSYRLFLLGVFTLSLCTAASAEVVINEIDYDQPGTDFSEFVELYNAGTATVNLSTYSLKLYNGTTAALYQDFALPDFDLAPGAFFVICASAVTTPFCDLDVSPDSNLIQNGAPDSAALFNDVVMVDAVSYEGTVAGITEGTGGAPTDGSLAFQGISRYPDGYDTDENSTDFVVACSTPGEANVSSSDNCFDPVPVTSSTWGSMKSLFR